jgi:hypothetical protein
LDNQQVELRVGRSVQDAARTRILAYERQGKSRLLSRHFSARKPGAKHHARRSAIGLVSIAKQSGDNPVTYSLRSGGLRFNPGIAFTANPTFAFVG